MTTSSGKVTSYLYDAAGNRVSKLVSSTQNPGAGTAVRYVRDAMGNALAVYEQTISDYTPQVPALVEQPIYGASRLGQRQTRGQTLGAATDLYTRTVGLKRYELTDHLGNVRALLTDEVLPVYSRTQFAPVGYQPEVAAYYNYYPFGQQQPGRTNPGNGTLAGGYRYGFNGKEKDNNGELGLTNYDYGFRIYNPGLGKFLSMDPLTRDYPYLTPYQFASNSPISGIDLDGLEFYYAADGKFLGQGFDPKNQEVRLAKLAGTTKSGNNMVKAVDLQGNATRQRTIIHGNHEEFKKMAGVLYAEADGTTSEAVEEVAGIYSTLENRASLENTKVVDQMTVEKGVYGAAAGEATKINQADNTAMTSKKEAVYAGLILGLMSDTDFSNGAYYWDGKDFNTGGGNRERYKPGFLFTEKNHDLFDKGSNKKPGKANGVSWDYKFESTGLKGKTTFSKLTGKWKDSRYPGKGKSDDLGQNKAK